MSLLPPWVTRISIWDIDNCVSDDGWRTSKIDFSKHGNERYDAYDRLMVRDLPAHTLEWDLITKLSTPVFITGRRERWREATRDWIERMLPLPDRDWPGMGPLILMRPEECEDRPVELKRKLLYQLRDVYGVEFSRIIAAFDDIPAIVGMYLTHGIPAAVLRVHDPLTAYTVKDLA